jgi:hypothetical protein
MVRLFSMNRMGPLSKVLCKTSKYRFRGNGLNGFC